MDSWAPQCSCSKLAASQCCIQFPHPRNISIHTDGLSPSTLLTEHAYIPQISPDGLLLQSSTISDLVPYTFSSPAAPLDTPRPPSSALTSFSSPALLKSESKVVAVAEPKSIAGGYVEFVERLPLLEGVGALIMSERGRRDGFEAGNADKIFQSTSILTASSS